MGQRVSVVVDLELDRYLGERIGDCYVYRHPRMFLSGVQSRTRLDSRLKHAGMTEFRLAINFWQRCIPSVYLVLRVTGDSFGSVVAALKGDFGDNVLRDYV